MDERSPNAEWSEAIERMDIFTIALGRRTAKYFNELLDRSVPADLAYLLVRDWHAAQLDLLKPLYRTVTP